MMVDEQYVEVETATLAKQQKFNWSVNEYYVTSESKCWIETGYFVNNEIDMSNGSFECCARVTQAKLQKWLREVHNIHVSAELLFHEGKAQWYALIENTLTGEILSDSDSLQETFETCLEQAIVSGLKLISDK